MGPGGRGDGGRRERGEFDLLVPAPPWSYDPSRWGRRIAIALLGTFGVLVSTYLALYQWGLVEGVWDPVFGAQTLHVLDSDVSERMRGWVGIPDAALGALAYLGDILFVLAGTTRRWQLRPWLVFLFGLFAIPLGVVSVTLIALQGTVVGAWCFLCLMTAPVSLVIIYLAFPEVWSSLQYLRRVARRSGGDRWLVWDAFWGRPSDLAAEAALLPTVADAEEARRAAADPRRAGRGVGAVRAGVGAAERRG